MMRGGINLAVVKKARDAILARGQYPSIDAVRAELGNTGSKSTIHRLLKELAAADTGHPAVAPTLSEELADLISVLAERLGHEAQAAVAEEREALAQERRSIQTQVQEAESRVQLLQTHLENLNGQLDAAGQALQSERELRQQAEIAVARLEENCQNQATLLQEREKQIQALDERHQKDRDTLEHYRQAAQDLRNQDRQRHESQVQQFQVEIKHLRETLSSKQDELTHLNRDNERLLTEARSLSRDLHTQQGLVEKGSRALGELQAQLASTEAAQRELERTNLTLEAEVQRLNRLRPWQPLSRPVSRGADREGEDAKPQPAKDS